jgi:hypothetical protein
MLPSNIGATKCNKSVKLSRFFKKIRFLKYRNIQGKVALIKAVTRSIIFVYPTKDKYPKLIIRIMLNNKITNKYILRILFVRNLKLTIAVVMIPIKPTLKQAILKIKCMLFFFKDTFIFKIRT